MFEITDSIHTAVQELLGRASGPLHFRLVLQPVVASILAIKAGLRDAREGRSPFLWSILTDRSDRRWRIHSGWSDIGKLFTIAFLIDTVYQLFVLHGFHLLQSLIVAFTVAVVPYVSLRGIVTRLKGRARQSPPVSRAA